MHTKKTSAQHIRAVIYSEFHYLAEYSLRMIYDLHALLALLALLDLPLLQKAMHLLPDCSQSPLLTSMPCLLPCILSSIPLTQGQRHMNLLLE